MLRVSELLIWNTWNSSITCGREVSSDSMNSVAASRMRRGARTVRVEVAGCDVMWRISNTVRSRFTRSVSSWGVVAPGM